MLQLIRAAAAAPPATYVLIQRRDRNVSVIKPVAFGNRVIRLENLTPILTPEERETRRREVENQLFGIFIKYM